MFMVMLKYLNELSFYYFAAQTDELAQVTYNSMYLCITILYDIYTDMALLC